MADKKDDKPTHHPEWPKRKDAILAMYPSEDTPGDMRLHQPGLVSTSIKSSPEFKEMMGNLLDTFKEPSKAALKELESFAVNYIFAKLHGSASASTSKKGKKDGN